ncbi:hypothetical protein J6590_097391 [Homalodisca vitripennis]|nr:hypothetical protein J6590_097391 [Homalodisca vitripennis]
MTLQKKWKNIKDSYAREKRRLSGVKSGSAAERKTPYVFYNTLTFLNTNNPPTNTHSNVDRQDPDNTDLLHLDIEAPAANPDPTGPYETRERRNREIELTSDEDRLFLMSLVSDLKRVPEHLKLSVKRQLMAVLEQNQVTPAGRTSYTGYAQNQNYQYPSHSGSNAQFAPGYSTTPYGYPSRQHTSTPLSSGASSEYSGGDINSAEVYPIPPSSTFNVVPVHMHCYGYLFDSRQGELLAARPAAVLVADTGRWSRSWPWPRPLYNITSCSKLLRQRPDRQAYSVIAHIELPSCTLTSPSNAHCQRTTTTSQVTACSSRSNLHSSRLRYRPSDSALVTHEPIQPTARGQLQHRRLQHALPEVTLHIQAGFVIVYQDSALVYTHTSLSNAHSQEDNHNTQARYSMLFQATHRRLRYRLSGLCPRVHSRAHPMPTARRTTTTSQVTACSSRSNLTFKPASLSSIRTLPSCTLTSLSTAHCQEDNYNIAAGFVIVYQDSALVYTHKPIHCPLPGGQLQHRRLQHALPEVTLQLSRLRYRLSGLCPRVHSQAYPLPTARRTTTTSQVTACCSRSDLTVKPAAALSCQIHDSAAGLTVRSLPEKLAATCDVVSVLLLI